MDWITLAAIATVVAAIATSIYTISFLGTLWLAYVQTSGFEKNRRLQEALTIFKELQVKEVRESRRYIYEEVPQEIGGLTDNELQKHLVNSEEAVLAFERVGYLLSQEHADLRHVISNYWTEIWKSWKRINMLIQWARNKRNDKYYLKNFENLFHIAEIHRVQSEYEEPKIYAISRIIT